MTATFVAITGLALRHVPDGTLALRLLLLMLPIQFAIGVANDVADAATDAVAKPYKPIVNGVVARPAAAVTAALLALLGLASAASINAATLGLAIAGLSAGLLYDAGVRRTPLSWLPWWLGMTALPLAAFAAAGRLQPRLLELLPLALLVALSLHCANALPDITDDARAGQRSLPVVLGERRARAVALSGLVLTGVLALVLSWLHGQGNAWLLGAAAVLALAVVLAAISRAQRPFPWLALATALFAVSWLATLAL